MSVAEQLIVLSAELFHVHSWRLTSENDVRGWSGTLDVGRPS